LKSVSIRERMLSSTMIAGVAVLAIGAAAPAYAQDVSGQVTEPTDRTSAQTAQGERPGDLETDNPQAGDVTDVEGIVVTGSRIVRPKLDVLHPGPGGSARPSWKGRLREHHRRTHHLAAVRRRVWQLKDPIHVLGTVSSGLT
jgi:hypothetical protein